MTRIETKTPLKSLTIAAALLGILTVVKDWIGWNISGEELEQIVTHIVEIVSLILVIYGRLRANKPLSVNGAPRFIPLLMLVLLAGCAGDMDSMKAKFSESGRIASVEIAGIHYSASDVLIVRGEELIPLVDYAKSLSPDEQERFKAAVGTASPELLEALKALMRKP